MPSRNALLAGLALAAATPAALADSVELTVTVSGARPPTGSVEITLFNSAASFLNQPYKQTPCTPAEDGSCTVSFTSLPEGDYALVVVHDANGNRKLDNGFLGFGAERFAYSNDASNPLFGRASFDDAKIRLDVTTEIAISLD